MQDENAKNTKAIKTETIKICGITVKLNRINLKLSNCNLDHIPEEINLLTKLQYLNLEGNQITKIQNLYNLTNLKTSNLKGNLITKIQCLDSLINLQKLNLEGNLIEKIENLEKLINLKDLSLSKEQGELYMPKELFLTLVNNKFKKFFNKKAY